MNKRLHLPLLLALLLLPACHYAPQGAALKTQASSQASTWIRTDLYFGLTRRDSSLIPEADFQAFVDQTITPQFPTGLTVFSATGQYLDSGKVLHKEPARVLTLLYSKSAAPAADQKIRRITTLYCQRFDQECVLRTDTPAYTEFLSAPVQP